MIKTRSRQNGKGVEEVYKESGGVGGEKNKK